MVTMLLVGKGSDFSNNARAALLDGSGRTGEAQGGWAGRGCRNVSSHAPGSG